VKQKEIFGAMGKKSKKDKKSKLPKKIAGVKVPKELRNAGGLLFQIARDANARDVALAALTAALAARKDSRKAARNAVGETGETVAKAGKVTALLGPALTAAAVEAGRLLLDNYDKGGKKAEADGADGNDRKATKNAPAKDEPTPGVTH